MIMLNEDIVLNKIFEALHYCGDFMKNMDVEKIVIEEKGSPKNIVTDCDKKIQEYLKTQLSTIIPGSNFIGEEGKNSYVPKGEYTFIVDPIDGTTNFSKGLNASAISVGLLKGNEPILGCCYNPYTTEMFYAIKGKGAYLNGKEIHVSNFPLKGGVVHCGSAPYNPEDEEVCEKMVRGIHREGGDNRRKGSAVLEMCDVASGRAEGFYEPVLKPWDHAAAGLILTEAGGIFKQLDGSTIKYNPDSKDYPKSVTSVLAANTENNFELLKNIYLNIFNKTYFS